MKAVTYRAFGPARDVLQIEEIPCPAPQPGEVTVDLAYSGVNPSDVKARAGARVGVTELPWPFIIPHSDGAGRISAVGEGVSPDRIGERVWVWNGQWQRPMGTAAEQITLPAIQAVPLPDPVSMQVGATLGIPGLTACHTVFCGGEVDGATVLVQGGAGSVGNLAVQLAKWGGARVIATCSAQTRDRVLAAGADAALDYSDPDLAAQVLAANQGRPVEHIVEVEFGANAETDAAVIAENGRIAAYGSARNMTPEIPFYPLMFKAVSLDLTLIYLLQDAPRQEAITRLHSALSAGIVQSDISETFDLQQFSQAHEAVETGARAGAVLLQTGDEG